LSELTVFDFEPLSMAPRESSEKFGVCNTIWRPRSQLGRMPTLVQDEFNTHLARKGMNP